MKPPGVMIHGYAPARAVSPRTADVSQAICTAVNADEQAVSIATLGPLVQTIRNAISGILCAQAGRRMRSDPDMVESRALNPLVFIMGIPTKTPMSVHFPNRGPVPASSMASQAVSSNKRCGDQRKELPEENSQKNCGSNWSMLSRNPPLWQWITRETRFSIKKWSMFQRSGGTSVKASRASSITSRMTRRELLRRGKRHPIPIIAIGSFDIVVFVADQCAQRVLAYRFRFSEVNGEVDGVDWRNTAHNRTPHFRFRERNRVWLDNLSYFFDVTKATPIRCTCEKPATFVICPSSASRRRPPL